MSSLTPVKENPFDRGTSLSPVDGNPFDAAAASQQTESSADSANGPRGLAFLNQGIATGLGAPVDLMNAALQAAGITGPGSISERASDALGLPRVPVEGPVGGSESIEQGMRATGVPVPESGAKPKTFPERIFRGVGEATGALVPLTGAASRLAQGTGLTAGVARSATETAVRNPLATAGAEAASGAGAGVGGGVADRISPDNPVAEVLGELAGGLSIPLAVKASALSVPRLALRAGKVALTPFTEAGGRVRAENRVQGLSQDPDRARERLNEDTISDLTPAQRTGEPRLMALERAVLSRDAALEGEFAERTARATLQLRNAMQDIGGSATADDARKFIETRRDSVLDEVTAQGDRRKAAVENRRGEQIAETEATLTNDTASIDRSRSASIDVIEKRKQRLLSALSLRAQQAAAIAEQRLSTLTPERRASESSVIVREEIESALSDAKAQENVLWAAVPKDTQVLTENSRRVFRAFDGQLTLDEAEDFPNLADLSLPRAQRDKMPAKARQFLAPDSNQRLQDVDTVQEVWGLRSDLLESARAARAAGENNTARIAENIADALLDDLGARTGDLKGEAGESLRAALDFSREVAERFRQGAVGRILGREKTGGDKVDPRLTLDATVGSGGVKGEVATSEILDAAPNSQEEIGRFLQDKFFRSSVRGDRLIPDAARRFATENSELLDRYPDLRNRILDAAEAQEDASRIADSSVSRKRQVGSASDKRRRNVDAEARESSRTAERLARETIRSIEALATDQVKRIDSTTTSRIKALQSPNESAAARFLSAPVDEEFSRVLKANNPRMAARELSRQVAKDETGRAAQGLKASVVDFLIRDAETGTFDDLGQQTLSGRRLQKALTDTRTSAALSEVLSNDEMRRLQRIASELSKIEASQGRLPDVGGVLNDVPSALLAMPARVMAARAGAQFGAGTSGASLLTANIFSQRAREFMSRLTNDTAYALIVEAVQDPRAFRALFSKTNTPKQQKQAAARFDAWLVGPGARFFEAVVSDEPAANSDPEPDRGAPTRETLERELNDGRTIEESRREMSS